ncbi:MAG: hypothetical protein HRT89_02550 [Lentisphaeria bacterium]|nr:hypothetical protein [Lentisphaeria bacterium]
MDQLSLEFNDRPAISIKDLRRAVMAWLLDQNVNAMADQIPTRIFKYKADIAACWTKTRKNPGRGISKILVPDRTAIIECRRTREECWPDCSNSRELSPTLLKLKQQRDAVQKKIRTDEPQLKLTDTLFEEYTDWEYEKSENQLYHTVTKEIEKYEMALYKGTRFEMIQKADLADFCWLAVPENTVYPHELAQNWGLLWVKADMSITVKIEADDNKCPELNKFHLIQNIAQSSMKDVLFSKGIYQTDDDVHFLPPPRRRRPKRTDS